MSNALHARFADLIARATGVCLNPDIARPDVVNGRLVFFAPVDDTAPVVEALVGVHGVDPSGITVLWLDDEAHEVDSYVGAVESLIGVTIDALTARLASLTGRVTL